MEILKTFLMALFIALPASAETLPYQVIAYHDVRDNVAEDYDPDQYALSTSRLIEQFTWLRDNGFRPVSIDEINAAIRGQKPLPDKAVLLTFDDGLASVYSHIYPLLKLFNYPAVVSVVTSWIESDVSVNYAGKNRGKEGFLTREQLLEMYESGLVEIASHTNNLHRGVRSNPQGSMQPAAVTRIYSDSGYESEAEYRQRIAADIAKSVHDIYEITRTKPRVIVWPYGAFDEISEEIAADLGLTFSMTLDKKSVVKGNRVRLGRYLISANPELYRFSTVLRAEPAAPIIRFAKIDLDKIFDTDKAKQSRNLDRMLDRIKLLKISHVFLQAFADKNADGVASAVYFPNRHLPMRENLFDFVSWQLKTRAEVEVFASLPLFSFKGNAFDPDWQVQEYQNGPLPADTASDPRLSPFNLAARQRIAEVYEDLATYAHLDGIYFDDDVDLANFEDFSAAARDRFQQEFSMELSPEILSGDSGIQGTWATVKSETLMEFSAELLTKVQRFNPKLKSARNIYSAAILKDSGSAPAGQNLERYLLNYDFAVLMAMPTTDSIGEEYYGDLITRVAQLNAGLDRTIFELRAVDWERSEPIPETQLNLTMRWLQSLGVRNLGFSTRDFLSERVDIDQLRLGISLADDFSGAGQ